MSSSGNGDGWPEGGLPDLPPDWGPVIIPDNAAELALEAAAVRRELRRRSQAARWQRRFGRFSLAGPRLARLPLLVLMIAILATLASLFTVIRANPSRQPGVRTSNPTVVPSTGGSGSTPTGTLPALDLIGERGELVSLRSLLPALIMVVDGCSCERQLDAAALAAPPEVTVVALVSGRVPAGPVAGRPTSSRLIRRLVDPTGEVRSSLRLSSPDGRATAVLVGRSARIVRIQSGSSDPAAEYGTELPELVNR